MFKKKKQVEEVEAPSVETEETNQDTQKRTEMPQISKKALEELKELTNALNEKYAYFFTPGEASQSPEAISKSLEISLLLAIYDELRSIRKLNE